MIAIRLTRASESTLTSSRLAIPNMLTKHPMLTKGFKGSLSHDGILRGFPSSCGVFLASYHYITRILVELFSIDLYSVVNSHHLSGS